MKDGNGGDRLRYAGDPEQRVGGHGLVSLHIGVAEPAAYTSRPRRVTARAAPGTLRSVTNEVISRSKLARAGWSSPVTGGAESAVRPRAGRPSAPPDMRRPSPAPARSLRLARHALVPPVASGLPPTAALRGLPWRTRPQIASAERILEPIAVLSQAKSVRLTDFSVLSGGFRPASEVFTCYNPYNQCNRILSL